MKEKPINFSDPMMRAVLSGLKNWTRRLDGLGEINACPDQWSLENRASGTCPSAWIMSRAAKKTTLACPFGSAGSVLWGREASRAIGGAIEYRCDNPDKSGRWAPSFLMPKSRSRIRLHVLDVRLERLDAMRDADAVAEGVGCDEKNFRHIFQADANWLESPLARFAALWDSVSPATLPFRANPWVWAIHFKACGI